MANEGLCFHLLCVVFGKWIAAVQKGIQEKSTYKQQTSLSNTQLKLVPPSISLSCFLAALAIVESNHGLVFPFDFQPPALLLCFVFYLCSFPLCSRKSGRMP